jgi:hypothetical protein
MLVSLNLGLCDGRVRVQTRNRIPDKNSSTYRSFKPAETHPFRTSTPAQPQPQSKPDSPSTPLPRLQTPTDSQHLCIRSCSYLMPALHPLTTNMRPALHLVVSDMHLGRWSRRSTMARSKTRYPPIRQHEQRLAANKPYINSQPHPLCK